MAPGIRTELAPEPFTDLILELVGSTLRIETMHLDRIDVYVDGHPRVSLETSSGNGVGVTEYIFESPWYQAEVVVKSGERHGTRRQFGVVLVDSSFGMTCLPMQGPHKHKNVFTGARGGA